MSGEWRWRVESESVVLGIGLRADYRVRCHRRVIRTKRKLPLPCATTAAVLITATCQNETLTHMQPSTYLACLGTAPEVKRLH
jgi:hypothetical protein